MVAALRVQMLDDISGEFDPITDADSNYGRVIGIKVASRTNPAIAEDMDVSPERKARVQVRAGARGARCSLAVHARYEGLREEEFVCACAAPSRSICLMPVR